MPVEFTKQFQHFCELNIQKHSLAYNIANQSQTKYSWASIPIRNIIKYYCSFLFCVVILFKVCFTELPLPARHLRSEHELGAIPHRSHSQKTIRPCHLRHFLHPLNTLPPSPLLTQVPGHQVSGRRSFEDCEKGRSLTEQRCRNISKTK